ncbi:MAG: TonB-dependent receptor [Bacteroidota bacterium]
MKQILVIILGLILLLVSDGLLGQGRPEDSLGGKDGTVMLSGSVKDKDTGDPLAFANIKLHEAKDSSIVGGGLTDEQGNFNIAARPGQYYLVVSFLGYKELLYPDVQVDGGNSRAFIGDLSMEAAGVELDAVEIAAEKSAVQFTLDKRIYNVSKDISAIGASAEELLQNLPSVEVDQDGNVSLRGSNNVRILIDGKPSGLIGRDNPDALRLLQGDLIERIEVITNPSSKYDAEGEVGIINIVLKKNRKKGVNGSFSVNTGFPQNHGVSANVNFRRKKLNLFTNVGIRYRESPGFGLFIQTLTQPETLAKFVTDRTFTRSGISPTMQFGSEFLFDSKNTLTVSGTFRYSDRNNETNIRYEDFDLEDNLLAVITRDQLEREDQFNYQADINYKRTFPQKDRVLTLDAQFAITDDTEKSDITEVILESGLDPVLQFIDNVEDREEWLVQADYVHPFGENIKIETGAKGTYRVIDNDFAVREQDDFGAEVPILGPGNLPFVNRFQYLETIGAAYGIFSQQLEKFSYQLGLRAEYTSIVVDIEQEALPIEKSYTNLFPSAAFSYKLNPKNTLQFSYSRRLTRPSYRSLTPFTNYSDARNLYGGNSDLDPEFTQALETGYLKYWEKGTFLISLYYRYRTDVIERITDTTFINGQLVARFRPVNLATQNNFGLEISGSQDLTKWWKISGNGNFFRSITEGEFNGLDLSADTYAFQGRLNSRFSFNRKTNIQMSGYYRSPVITTQGRRKSIQGMDFGISQEILKGKGTLTFSVRDVFNSRVRRAFTETPVFTRETTFQWRQRQFTLSFNYRLNQEKRGRGGRRGGGRPSGGGDGGDF